MRTTRSYVRVIQRIENKLIAVVFQNITFRGEILSCAVPSVIDSYEFLWSSFLMAFRDFHLWRLWKWFAECDENHQGKAPTRSWTLWMRHFRRSLALQDLGRCRCLEDQIFSSEVSCPDSILFLFFFRFYCLSVLCVTKLNVCRFDFIFHQVCVVLFSLLFGNISIRRCGHFITAEWSQFSENFARNK